MKSLLLVAAIMVTALYSCAPKPQTGRTTIPFVSGILQDEDNRYNTLLRGTSSANPSGSIYIIGDADAVLSLAEDFAVRDSRDNVDGSIKPDGLPDFAGETISCILDTAGLFKGILSEALAGGNDTALREFAVRLLLGAVDPVCHISPYDIEGIGSKSAAKLVVLADPYLAQYAGHDIDTLLTSSGSVIPVICPIDEMLEVAFASNQGRDINMGVICDGGYAGSDIYARWFSEASDKAGSMSSGFTCLPASAAADSVLVSFLDGYIAKGDARPLNVIAVDTYSVSPDKMKSDYAGLISLMNEDSMKYARYFAKDFRFLHAADAVTSRCYELLRTGNLFTHNIAKPQIETFYPAFSPEDEKELFLVPGNYVQN